ncbi:MAG TPA: YqaE/Pmp3 family membrane protein [Chitinophagaceae bacterium]
MNRMFTRMLVLFLALTVMATPVISATLPAHPATTDPAPSTVKAAVSEFNNLSKKEKKERVKEVKKAIKQHKADKRAGKQADTNTILLVILAILLPPLAVYLHEGAINNRFWISLLLTLLFWIPGVIYALIIILGDE